MKRRTPSDMPRWMGWLLATSGGVLALMMFALLLILGLFADEPWADVAVDLIGWAILGVIGASAGIRILRAHHKASFVKGQLSE